MKNTDHQYQTHTLASGMKIVHQPWHSGVSHLGLFIRAGSRDEKTDENGMAHFIEHTIFKGTRKRKAYQVLNRLEVIGGELNAYTTKEETCLYASFPTENYLPRAFELFSDIIFQASFPHREIEKEKEIVLDEINSYLDSPSEYIFDEFEQLFFRNHPLSGQILGSPERVKSFSRDMLLHFKNTFYRPGQMVLSYCGDASFERLVRQCEKYFGVPDGNAEPRPARNLQDDFNYRPFELEIGRNSYQTHCVLGMPAPKSDHHKRPVMSLLNNMLGGPGLNSKLNMSLREKHAYSYLVESSYTAYEDQGLHTIYLGTDKKYLKKSLKVVRRELEKLSGKLCGNRQFSLARKQILGQFDVMHDSGQQKMLSAGKSLLHQGELKTIPELRQEIFAISREELRQLAEEVYRPENISMLVYPGE